MLPSSKHNTLTQWCFDVGPPSTTLFQHQKNIGSLYLVLAGMRERDAGVFKQQDHHSVTIQSHPSLSKVLVGQAVDITPQVGVGHPAVFCST